jgi:hypothetical protein
MHPSPESPAHPSSPCAQRSPSPPAQPRSRPAMVLFGVRRFRGRSRVVASVGDRGVRPLAAAHCAARCAGSGGSESPRSAAARSADQPDRRPRLVCVRKVLRTHRARADGAAHRDHPDAIHFQRLPDRCSRRSEVTTTTWCPRPSSSSSPGGSAGPRRFDRYGLDPPLTGRRAVNTVRLVEDAEPGVGRMASTSCLNLVLRSR